MQAPYGLQEVIVALDNGARDALAIVPVGREHRLRGVGRCGVGFHGAEGVQDLDLISVVHARVNGGLAEGIFPSRD